MANPLQPQYVQIASQQVTHTPAFRVRGATQIALASPGLDPVGGSAQSMMIQAAFVLPDQGGGALPATSAQFVNVMVPGFSSLASFVTSGGFVVNIANLVQGFDEIRVVASSAQANSVRSLSVFVKL